MSLSRRDFLNTTLWTSACALAAPAMPSLAQAGTALPRFANRIPGTAFELRGHVREYLAGVTANWLKVAPLSNPAMLEMFRDRDRQPPREMVPWAGEFAGKHLTSAIQVWRVTGEASLKAFIADFVARLIPLQAEDGYLGPWPKDSRLKGHAPNSGPKGGETWDAWGHYHLMLGLLMWHEDTKDEPSLACARRIGDLFCQKFKEARLVDTGATEMNLAPIHALCLLHHRTGEKRYLDLALKICGEFSAKAPDGKPLAGDYLEAALAGKEFFQMPKPRWESLHPIMGLAELHALTGEGKYRRACEHIWWSIVKLDRHNNGGFSSGEQAQGNPYHLGAIETCCTIAWIAFGVEVLRFTANSIVADELELSTLNSVLGLHSPNGRWVTYNTPMDGTRKASAHDIVFQARAGSPELNCCSVNGARGLGMISDWALLRDGDAIVVNWYGPASIVTQQPNGSSLGLTMETNYPREPRVKLTINPAVSIQWPFKFRIPHWSQKTVVKLNGEAVPDVKPGAYLTLNRVWSRGDVVEIEFDFSLHFWSGERECGGKVSVFRGPILLTYDRRFNNMDPHEIPTLDAATMTEKPAAFTDWLPPVVLLEFATPGGRPVRLCDFASAGAGGSPYRSWLEIKNAPRTEFSPIAPLRSGRATPK